MIPLAVELTAPALFAAGLAASPHCALMCGALGAAQMRTRGAVPWREAQLLVHWGRVLGYSALGALAGTLGAVLLPALPQPGIGRIVQGLAALLLILGGLLQFRGAHILPRACCARPPECFARWPARVRLFLQGLAWAALPCGILYGVLMLASFTGSAAGGALLMASFGLGTVPLLLASGGLAHALTQARGGSALQYGAGIALIFLGVAAGAAALSHGSDLFAWCAHRV